MKRLDRDELKALVAEINAAIAPYGPAGERRLAELAGLHRSMIYQVRKAMTGTTHPTALKIRNAIRALSAETPVAEPATLAVSAPKKKRGRMPGDYAAKAAAQEPLRQRAREIMSAQHLSVAALARHAGTHASVLSSFMTGKSLHPKNLSRVDRGVTTLEKKHGTATTAHTVPERRAMVQHTLQLNGAPTTVRQIDVMAARVRTVQAHNVLAQPEHTSTAVQIARDTLNDMGLRAIEALLQIAKSNQGTG